MRLLAFLGLAIITAACSTNPDKNITLSEKAYYDAAQKSLSYGNFDTASKHLEELESHYPVGAYTEQAKLDLIYARYKHLDYAGAMSAAERLIRNWTTLITFVLWLVLIWTKTLFCVLFL